MLQNITFIEMYYLVKSDKDRDTVSSPTLDYLTVSVYINKLVFEYLNINLKVHSDYYVN